MSLISQVITEVQFQNKTKLEHVADTLLIPARYFWNGRKIDYIQSGNDRGLQIAKAFPNSFTWLQTVTLVITLIPGFLLGGSLKVYALACSRSQILQQDVIEALKEAKLSTRQQASLFYPQGLASKKFREHVGSLITALATSTPLPPDQAIFLSEISSVRLMKTQCIQGRLQEPRANQTICEQLSFLWNLKQIEIPDEKVLTPTRQKAFVQYGITTTFLKKTATS